MRINSFRVTYVWLGGKNDRLFDAITEIALQDSDSRKCVVSRDQIDEAIISGESEFLKLYLKNITSKIGNYSGDIIFVK